ncbi:MAG: (2Fe-2S)-binding protein [Phycisphaerales bacterium]
MPVDRCVCHAVPFTELTRLIDAGLRTVDELSERTACCTGCGMCEPYVRLVIATGRTSFPPLSPAAIERAILEAERSRESAQQNGPGAGPDPHDRPDEAR